MEVDIRSLQELPPTEAPTLGAVGAAFCCTVPLVDCPGTFVSCFGCTKSSN